MFAMVVQMPSPEMQAAAPVLGVIVSAGLIGIVGLAWCVSKLPAAVRRMVGAGVMAVVVAVSVLPELSAQTIVADLQCCQWALEWLFACIPPGFLPGC